MNISWCVVYFGIGLVILFISFFLKKILIYMALVASMLGAVFGGLNNHPWLQICAALLALYGALMIIKGFLSDGGYNE
jgi:hypothetical protein